MLKKFFSFSIGTWLGALIGFVTIPLITHFFPPEDLGKLSMFTLALNILVVITMFGVDQSFVRFYYEEKPSALLRKSLVIAFIVFILVTIILFLFRTQLSIYLFGVFSPALFFLLSIATIISVISNYASQILRMEQKGFHYSLTQLGLRFFELIFIFVLIMYLRKDYLTLVYAKILTLIVVTIYSIFVSRKIWFDVRKRLVESNYSYSEIINYSYPLAFAMLINWAIQGFDKIALNEWSTVSEIGIYTAAFRIVLILQLIQTSFTTYWIPLSFEKFLKNDNDLENKVFFSNANSAISAIMLLAGAGLIMTKDIIVLLLGSEYRTAISMIPFLVLSPVLATISESTAIGISFHKKVRVVLLISFLTLVCCMGFNMLLVPGLHGIGAAIATGISAVVLFIFRTHFSLKYYKVNYNLKKFYIYLLLLICYALYSTFTEWNILNPVLGCLLISIIIFGYLPVISKLFRNLNFAKNQIF